MATALALDPNAPATQIGFVIKEGGLITVNEQPISSFNYQSFTYFKLLRVTVAGNLFVMGVEGNIIPFIGVFVGEYIPVLGKMVVNNGTYVTTATCYWYGGV